MSENSTAIQEKPPQRKITRRQFLQLLGAAAITSLLPGEPLPKGSGTQVAKSEEKAEKEPALFQPALVIDVPPLADKLREYQEKGVIGLNTKPFDVDSFFKKHAGLTYTELKKMYGGEAETNYPQEGDRGLLKTLLKSGREKEAVMIAFSFQIAEHGEAVGNYARYYRDKNNKPGKPVIDESYKPEKLDVTPYPLQPYEIFPLQDFVQKIEKSEEVDEYGNPYYDVVIDHKNLAAAISEYLKENPNKVLNFSDNVAMRLRLGYRLPENHLPKDITYNNPEGWLQDYYHRSDRTENGMAIYSYPPIAIETGYSRAKNLIALKEFAEALPEDVTLVTAAGNSQAALQPGQYFDDTGGVEPAPAQNFYGKPGLVFYAVSEVSMSSLSTARVSEWLVEHRATEPVIAQRLLKEHSKVFKKRNIQILDFVEQPIADWDNPEIFATPRN